MAETNEIKEILLQALMLLASKPDVQLRLVPSSSSSNSSEEIALAFEEALMQFEDVMESVGTTATQKEKLKNVDNELEKISKAEHSNVWSESSLKTGKEWEQIRKLATEALQSFGRPLSNPDISHLSFSTAH